MAGTDRNSEQIAGGPAIVLVEPQLHENIGMVARAMANFGLDDLRLVAPRDGWPSDKARAAASRADHVIDAARVFATLDEAVADLNAVLATTARQRDNFKPVLGPGEAARDLRARHAAGQGCGILFGRERWGLNNDEIARADAIVTYPVNPAFASLNIAQAVLLMSYEWMQSGLETPDAPRFAGPEQAPATRAELASLFDYLEPALDSRGYFRTADKKPKMMDNLRSVFTRPGFSASELAVIRGIFVALEKFSPKKPRGSGAPEKD